MYILELLTNEVGLSLAFPSFNFNYNYSDTTKTRTGYKSKDVPTFNMHVPILILYALFIIFSRFKLHKLAVVVGNGNLQNADKTPDSDPEMDMEHGSRLQSTIFLRKAIHDIEFLNL